MPGSGRDRFRHVPPCMTVLRLALLPLLPVPIAPSLSIVFWTAFLSLLVAVSISFFKNLTMSRSSRKDGDIREFVKLTGATVREAKRYLDKHRHLDSAMEAYMNGRENMTPAPGQLEKVFNQYKDRDDEDITVDGTLNLCSDLGLDPEDVVLLAVAYELQSPRVGRWKKSGWVQGWRGLG
ncbi:hypothetical protein BGW80DRAFT_736621 [Lactifluus volemus]|nr:hypothetical protein BGW80DRAFT_736621 [Lactifluus volemus]